MGPRQALADIMSMIKLAKATHDPAEVQELLSEIEKTAQAAIGPGTLRQARLLQLTRRQM
jgi:hypothetical protein